MLIYIDMDDVLCDYTTAFHQAINLTPSIAFPQSQYGFYANLTPIIGAIESVNTLIKSEKFDPYILTAPSNRNPLSYTEKRVWIEKYFGIAFTILIDDQLSGRGQDKFDGQLIHFGSTAYPNWKSIMNTLTQKNMS
jgi:5'-nucleotidase